MKVFLIVLFCIQQPYLNLDDTCVTEIQREAYNNISECMYSLSQVKQRAREVPNLFTTGFCTTKNVESA